jgi:hypothetical protein
VTTVLEEPFNGLAAWTTIVGFPAIVAGRTGTGVGAAGGYEIAYPIPAGDQNATIIVGFAAYVDNYPAAAAQLLWLYSDSNATQHTGLRLTNLGALVAQRGSSIQVGISADGVVPVRTWCYIEVRFVLGDSPNGSATVRVNGTTVINVTGIDTKQGGTKTVYDTVRLTGPTSVGLIADDLYVLSGPGETFRGDIHLGGASAKTWNGSAFVAAPVKVWNGSAFVDAVGIKTWNGSIFV